MESKKIFESLKFLETERINSDTVDIDRASIIQSLEMINNEDRKVAEAIGEILPTIALAVEKISESFKKGGRLFYFGAGTSGRLGILDAAECPPTFGTDPEQVQAFIAGGKDAVFRAVEGAEDSFELGGQEVVNNSITTKDVVCGIAASGRTPYVAGALQRAKIIGCTTILISTVSPKNAIENGCIADIMICPNVGAEVIAGSTRMKSGTAQKMILNMLTTASMVQIGKTFGNVMIDLQPKNAKLKERSKRIIMDIAGVDYDAAESALIASDMNVKTAIVSLLANVKPIQAKKLIANAGGKVRDALQMLK